MGHTSRLIATSTSTPPYPNTARRFPPTAFQSHWRSPKQLETPSILDHLNQPTYRRHRRCCLLADCRGSEVQLPHSPISLRQENPLSNPFSQIDRDVTPGVSLAPRQVE